jgi:hypothetical protein
MATMINHTILVTIHLGSRPLYRYSNNQSHHIAGNKYIENLLYHSNGQITQSNVITIVAVITMYSINFITTEKNSSNVVFSKVEEISC